jgi:hypothetical protein
MFCTAMGIVGELRNETAKYTGWEKKATGGTNTRLWMQASKAFCEFAIRRRLSLLARPIFRLSFLHRRRRPTCQLSVVGPLETSRRAHGKIKQKVIKV